MVEKIKERIKSMNLSCYTPKELYYLVLTLIELELYEEIIMSNSISTLSSEDYD